MGAGLGAALAPRAPGRGAAQQGQQRGDVDAARAGAQQHGEVADKAGWLQFQRRGWEHGAGDNSDDRQLRSDYESGWKVERRRGGSVEHG